MTIHELTIGKYSTRPDTFAAAYDDGTTGPHRRRPEDAERDYSEANAHTGDTRTAIENYRADSPIFQPWASIHADFRSNYLGRRHVLALDTRTGGTVLAPWLGPEALDTQHSPTDTTVHSSTADTRPRTIIAQIAHHTLNY